MTTPLQRSVALVTGASSGIGTEFARQLASEARAVVLVARRAERLEALARDLEGAHPGLTVRVEPCDVTDRAALDAMLARVEESLGGIDVLINNAGMGDFGVYDRVSWDKTERMIELNVTSLAYLTRRLVAPMVARGRGAILNVSSGFGLQFLPGFAAYVGTKHFVTAFSECLRLELRGTGVVVSQLCPGPVATEFEALSADVDAPKVPAFLQITAAQCARAGLRGLARGSAMVVPGVLMKLLLALGAWSPRWLLRLVYAPMVPAMRALKAKGEVSTSAP